MNNRNMQFRVTTISNAKPRTTRLGIVKGTANVLNLTNLIQRAYNARVSAKLMNPQCGDNDRAPYSVAVEGIYPPAMLRDIQNFAAGAIAMTRA